MASLGRMLSKAELTLVKEFSRDRKTNEIVSGVAKLKVAVKTLEEGKVLGRGDFPKIQ